MRTGLETVSAPSRARRQSQRRVDLSARIATCLVVSALVASHAHFALADDLADEAEVQFEAGADRYRAHDFSGALEHFLASNRLVANRNVMFNIARAYEQLHQNTSAYRYYNQALEGETDATSRSHVQQAIARLASSVAVLAIETDPPGASVFVDRKDLGSRGTTPVKLGLNAGSYKLIIERSGYEPSESQVSVTLGVETPLKVALKQIVGMVRVDAEPAGSVVHLETEDAAPIGTAPATLPIAPGRHTLVVTKEGYSATSVTVDVPAYQSITIHPRLAPIAGDLIVNADVRDALVEVDGRALGFTPAVLTVPVGPHTVRVSHEGFRAVEKTTLVNKAEQAKLDVQLSEITEVTAASRVTENIEDAPSSVTIITGQEIRAMGYPTVAEALRGVRGIYVSNDTSYDSIGVRGFSRPGDYGSRVLVLLDGHPLNDNYVGQSYFGYDGRVDLADIDRIEVIRGPGSVVYGTGAFLGVINLVTRSRSAPTHSEAGLTAAGNGVGAARVMQQVRFSPDAGIWTSVSAAHGAGADYYFKELASDPATGGNVRGNDGFDAGNVTGRVWYKWATLQWYVNSRNKNLPSAEYGTVVGDSRLHYTDTRGTLELRLEPTLGKTVEWLTRAHLDLYNFDDFLPYLVESGGNATESFRGQWAGLEQRVAYTPNKLLRITVGGEVQDDFKAVQSGVQAGGISGGVTTAPLTYLTPVNRAFQVGAGYGNIDFTPVKQLKVTGGARYDYYSNFGGSLNPRVAVILKPYDGGNLKAMFGKAFRAPSVYEHYYNSPTQLPGDCAQVDVKAPCLSQAALKPENVYSGELEFTQRFSPTIHATVAGYTNYITDIINLSGGGTSANPNQYVNVTNPIQTYGGEVELRRDWRDGWMAAVSYSYQDTEYLDNTTTRLRNVPDSPHHLGALKGAAPILDRVLVLATRLTFEGPVWDKYDQPTDPVQTQTNPFFIWDVVLSGEAERYGVRYNLGLYNATDQRVSLPVSREFTQDLIQQPGRTVLAQVSVKL